MTTNSPRGSFLLTGANGGLGTAIVASLLSSPHASDHHGIYAVRNPSTAHPLQTVLSKNLHSKSHQHEILPLELNSLQSVRTFAASISLRVANGTLPPIRALILNAGWQEANSTTLKPQTFTEDGFEANFGINYLANFLLVLLLIGSMDKEHGRIVCISSSTHDTFAKVNEAMTIFGDGEREVLKGGTESLVKGVEYSDDGFKAGVRRYGASKTLMVMFMYSLQARLSASPTLSKISILSLDPGGMLSTGMTRNSVMPLPLPTKLALKYIYPPLRNIISYISPNGPLRTTSKSAGDVMDAVFDVKRLGEHPKAVYLDGSAVVLPSLEARDEVKQRMVWEDSLRLAKVAKAETVLPLV